MLARAFYRAVVVDGVEPPYNVITLKIFYPALWSQDPQALATGIMPPDTSAAPFPLMVFWPGVNCDSAMYHWLAAELAQNGLVVVLMSWIAQNLPGRISLTPGIDLSAIQPDDYGARPTASSLGAILRAVGDLMADGPLAGLLDMKALILAGHSAGGTLALQNADPRFVPGVAGAIAYCANPLATTALGGFSAGFLPPLPAHVPTLMIGATEDGIGTHHNSLYGRVGHSGADTIRATFQEAFAREQGDSYCVILRGANHYTIGYPLDTAAGRAFLDTPETGDNSALRRTIADLMCQFVRAYVRGDTPAKTALDTYMRLSRGTIAEFIRK